MNHSQKYFTVFIFPIILLLFINKNYAQISSDSLICKNYDNVKIDSLNMKPSKAPIIAFGIVGAILGGVVGGSIDPPKKGVEGEMFINISKTGATFFVLGGFCGSYIGYRLAKRQVEKKTKALKKGDSEVKEFNFRPYKN